MPSWFDTLGFWQSVVTDYEDSQAYDVGFALPVGSICRHGTTALPNQPPTPPFLGERHVPVLFRLSATFTVVF